VNLGKKVKVRDMQRGWTYTMPDKTIEELYKEQCMYPPHLENMVPNTGLFLAPDIKHETYDDTYGFQLYLVYEANELAEKALRPGQQGTFQVVRTGNKIWTYHPNYTVWVKVDSLDFEMEEAHPFPIAVVRDDYEPIPLPNPWNWRKASDRPVTKADNHVEVWDESDAKTIIVLVLISFMFLLAGPSGWAMLIMIWLVAMAYFHSKHEKIRKEILEEREKNGVRGSGLDHKFRW
jgi:hypothetical protein